MTVSMAGCISLAIGMQYSLKALSESGTNFGKEIKKLECMKRGIFVDDETNEEFNKGAIFDSNNF